MDDMKCMDSERRQCLNCGKIYDNATTLAKAECTSKPVSLTCGPFSNWAYMRREEAFDGTAPPVTFCGRVGETLDIAVSLPGAVPEPVYEELIEDTHATGDLF